MARKRRKKEINTFILSFVDVIASAVGTLIFLTIIVSMNVSGREEVSDEIKKAEAYIAALENNSRETIALEVEIDNVDKGIGQINDHIEQENNLINELNSELNKLKEEKTQNVLYKNPILRKTNKESLLFECRNNHIAFIDFDLVGDEFMEYIKKGSTLDRMGSQNEYMFPEYSHIENYQVKTTIKNRNYRDAAYIEFIFKPNTEWKNSGDDIDNINNPNSNFNRIVSSINSHKQFVRFYIGPDSFNIFRAARDILWENNIDSNWIPKETDEDVEIVAPLFEINFESKIQ